MEKFFLAVKYKSFSLQKYQEKIEELQQPLILSKPKKKDIRGGQEENIVLIPELCLVTGISDEMRRNFELMRDIAAQMKMSPGNRVKSLKKFNNRLQMTKDVCIFFYLTERF